MLDRALTRKQQAFIDYWLNHPKASGTEAALATYDTDDPVVAASIAHENLRKPQIMAHLQSVGQLTEGAIVGTIRAWKDSESPRKREIALDAAKYSHDKVFGRAATRGEAREPQVVRIAINLTGDGKLPPEAL